MKILAIIGSPRRGNTYRSVQKIEQYHKGIADCEYEYLFLKDLDFGLCKGCFACISHGEERCPLKDDRDLIVNKIEAADSVILASPNYVQNVSWLMKNFIDRFAFILHRPRYFNQKFMLVITSGSYMGVDSAMKALALMASGGKVVSRLSVFISPGMNDKKTQIQEERIRKSAEKFARALNAKPQKAPSLAFLIWFSVFKASSAANQVLMPADYRYYKDKSYFTDVPLGAVQKATVKLFTRFFGLMIKMGLV